MGVRCVHISDEVLGSFGSILGKYAKDVELITTLLISCFSLPKLCSNPDYSPGCPTVAEQVMCDDDCIPYPIGNLT